MKFKDVDVYASDIVLTGKRLSSFYFVKDLFLMPWDLIRFKTPRLLNDFVSSRIQQDTQSVWNHVEIISGEKDGKILSIGAQPHGVREAFLFEEYPEKDYRLAILRPKKELTPLERKEIVEYARKRLGLKYSFKNIFRIRWALLIGGLGKLNSLVTGKEKFEPVICSQLVDRAHGVIADVLPKVGDYPAPRSFYDSVLLDKVIVLI